MDTSSLEFRKLDQSGVDTLVGWAKEEGWDPGLSDAQIFYQTDPDGFYGYYAEDEMIAGGAIISYRGKFGFMGLFIVKPTYRGKGLGRTLWYKRRDMLLDRLNEGAAIGMDGVVDMQPFYAKGGFELAYRDERYVKVGEVLQVSSAVRHFAEGDMKLLLELDLKCSGFERPHFWELWLGQSNVQAFVSENENGRGVVVMRKTGNGYKIGPLFAENDSIAEDLYRACLSGAPGANVYLDIPVINEHANELVKKYRAQYVFECARMYYGQPPKCQTEKVFGLTTFELG